MNPNDLYLTGHERLYELSQAQANSVLQRFLELEREFFSSASFLGVDLDKTQDSVLNLYRYVLDSGEYTTENQSLWDARCGFYFGDALCTFSSRLSWTIGEKEYAFENHPVVAGFRDKMEVPVITMSHNGLSSIIEGRNGFERI